MGQEKNRQLKRQREQQRSRKRLYIGGGVAFLVALVVVIVLFWPGEPDEWSDWVAQGQPALANVESPENQGDQHLAAGTQIPYEADFPTSGPHWPSPTRPGFYTVAQPNEALVHAIEHGNIVIYYNDLSAAEEAQLRDWTDFYTGSWSAVTAVPHSGLGNDVVLTAWDHRLRLGGFEPAAMAAFIDAYRGRGPENSVR